MMMALRTTMPTRLTMPRMEVMPKSMPNIFSPMMAPSRQSRVEKSESSARLIFFSAYTRQKKMIRIIRMNPLTICGSSSMLVSSSPP